MPSPRLAFRIDVSLVLGFVAICAYARRVELERRAPLESGPQIGKTYTSLSKVAPAPIVVAARPQSGTSKLDPAQATSTRAGESGGSTIAISAKGAAGLTSASLQVQILGQQSCANGGSGSSCSSALAEVAPSGTPAPSETITPAGSVTSANVGGSDDEASSSEPFMPTGVGVLPIMPLYADMLGAPGRNASASPSGGEPYEPDASGVGYTPTYPWEAQLLMPVVGNPVPFYILPPTVWLPDNSKKDDPTKKFGDVDGFDRNFPGNKLATNQAPVTATPEPATLTMLATGFVALGTMRRRRKRIAAD
jgi:hypothetical protein